MYTNNNCVTHLFTNIHSFKMVITSSDLEEIHGISEKLFLYCDPEGRSFLKSTTDNININQSHLSVDVVHLLFLLFVYEDFMQKLKDIEE